MKIFYVILVAFIYLGILQGQTWVTTPYLGGFWPSVQQDTATVGPIEIRPTPDGNIIMTVQVNPHHDSWLIKYDSIGNLLWSKPVAHFATAHSEFIHSLNATIDNGCVYSWRYQGSTTSYQDSVVRRDENGNLIWSKYFHNSQTINEVIISVTQSFYNTTFIQFLDSLVEVDSIGAFIRHRFPFSASKKIVQLPDSNFLVFDSGMVRKENFNGVQQWSASTNVTETALCINSPYIYVDDNDTIKKINTQNGSIVWSNSISIETITATSDDGFMGINADRIMKYDSAGNLQWIKIIDFSRYALRGLAELPGKNYVTGGCWMMEDLVGYERYYAFITKLDSMRNGVIDSTHNFYLGNTNDNNLLSFADDAVYIAAAMGSTGLTRDSILQCDTSINCLPVMRSVYGTNWSTGFAAGINHRFSDVNGDGMIDTIDIKQLSHGIWMTGNYHVNPHWFRQSNLSPELRFDIRNTQVTSNDTLIVDLILGSGSLAVDSIYGFSTELWFNFDSMMLPNNPARAVTIPLTSLGDSSSNLYTFIDYGSFNSYFGTTRMVLCRTDNQNAYVAGDTVANLFIDLSNLPPANDTMRLKAYANAITVGGFPVTLSIVEDSVLFSSTTSIEKKNNNKLIVYPNPVNDILQIDNGSESISEILIYDCIGNLVIRKENLNAKVDVDVKQLTTGIYILKCVSGEKVVTRKIIVE